MNWEERFWIVWVLWVLEAVATFYWRRRCRRLEERVAESWFNYVSHRDRRKP